MKTAELYSTEERSRGFSHCFKITFADFTTAGLTQTLTLITPVAVGDYVTNCGFFLKTQFASPAMTSFTIQLGYTGTVAGFIAAAQLHAAQTPILAGDATGSDFATLRTGKAFVTAPDIIATFTSITANVNTATAGEVWVYLNILRLSNLGFRN